MSQPVVAKGEQAREGFAVLGAIRRLLAGNDVIEAAHGKALDVHVASPGLIEGLDSVRRENQVEVEWAVLQLNEVLAPADLRDLLGGQAKPELDERVGDRRAVRRILLDEQIGILRGIRETEED